MTNIDWNRATRYFLLMDFIKGFGLGMKYFFAPKTTLNDPHENIAHSSGRPATLEGPGGFRARWAVEG